MLTFYLVMFRISRWMSLQKPYDSRGRNAQRRVPRANCLKYYDIFNHLDLYVWIYQFGQIKIHGVNQRNSSRCLKFK